MTQLALYVQLEAKPGKEQEVAAFLSGARRIVEFRARYDRMVRHQDGAANLRHFRRLR